MRRRRRSPDEERARRRARNEALVLALIAGLPAPDREVRFHPTRRWRFDLAWPERRIAVEVDGGIYQNLPSHSSIAQRERDYEKTNEAAALGWRVLRYTYTTLRRDLAACRSQLWRALLGREPGPPEDGSGDAGALGHRCGAAADGRALGHGRNSCGSEIRSSLSLPRHRVPRRERAAVWDGEDSPRGVCLERGGRDLGVRGRRVPHMSEDCGGDRWQRSR